METNEQKLKRLSELVEKYNSKLNFSIVSFIFFTFMFAFCLISSQFPIVFSIVFGLAILIFIQQIIRSYNYKRFYEIYYNANVIIDEMFDK
jgi:hypothetical protein